MVSEPYLTTYLPRSSDSQMSQHTANGGNVLQIVGYPISWEMLTSNIQKGQDYLIHNTTLGIPALVQTEGIHGFLIGNATIFNSPIGYGASWNRDVRKPPDKYQWRLI